MANADPSHRDHMARAIELARQAIGSVSPNPPAGAVIVSGGRIVGEGFTRPPGQEHAEIVALHQAGEAARGAEVYVTLEPCAHSGRTPPCTDALIAAGVSRVHIAALDPAHHTDDRGVATLEGAGISVMISDASPEARELIESFTKHITTGIPFVVAKFALSLDGKIATAAGSSRWISNEASLRRVHRLRAGHDAIMIGIGTALADDPQLTVRDAPVPRDRQPTRVVIDTTARLALDAAMLRQDGTTLVAIADAPDTRRRALETAGAELLSAPGDGARVDLAEVLRQLGERNITSVLVEGGATLLGALFDARLVDKVIAFVAPVIIGGDGAPSPVGGSGAGDMAQAIRLAAPRHEEIEGDVMITGYPVYA